MMVPAARRGVKSNSGTTRAQAAPPRPLTPAPAPAVVRRTDAPDHHLLRPAAPALLLHDGRISPAAAALHDGGAAAAAALLHHHAAAAVVAHDHPAVATLLHHDATAAAMAHDCPTAAVVAHAQATSAMVVAPARAAAAVPAHVCAATAALVHHHHLAGAWPQLGDVSVSVLDATHAQHPGAPNPRAAQHQGARAARRGEGPVHVPASTEGRGLQECWRREPGGRWHWTRPGEPPHAELSHWRAG